MVSGVTFASDASAALRPAEDARRALSQMHRYTTISLVFVVAAYASIAVVAVETLPVRIALLLGSIALVALVFFWERPGPRWLTIVTLVLGMATWLVTLWLQDNPTTSLLLGTALGILLAQSKRTSWHLVVLGILPLFVPLGLAALFIPEMAASAPVYALVAAILYGAAAAAFLLNRYGWNRYLEIDAARRTGAELAVVQERYRFAADLHDIQGHTLHVLRLKTQLADKLIDRDPAAAHEHLAEALELITETLAQTRSLAFGERRVAVASELANARELFEAAGIRWTTHGSFPTHPHEELFGLVVREATTNILRHAQASEVTVRLGRGSIVVSNDGAPATPGPLSGLARLGERFEVVGGSLRTASVGGRFSTEAEVADSPADADIRPVSPASPLADRSSETNK
ncbi:MAG: hypothetical protein JWQ43_1069 [Glaciihabitans sp.]|nr:hypothetical protein [Glaciihabitans sp.]